MPRLQNCRHLMNSLPGWGWLNTMSFFRICPLARRLFTWLVLLNPQVDSRPLKGTWRMYISRLSLRIKSLWHFKTRILHMFWHVFRFEVSYHRRQPLVYSVTAVFFLLTFLATTTPNVTLGGGTDSLNINAPFAIMQSLAAMSLLCVFTAITFSANPVIRDYDYGTAELFLPNQG